MVFLKEINIELDGTQINLKVKQKFRIKIKNEFLNYKHIYDLESLQS